MSKRSDYLTWDEYFLSVAFLSGMRSKDPCTQVGACIVNQDKIIVSIGYNGMPRGCEDDCLPWGKQSENALENKYMYVCHAEMNAVLNKNSADVSGCTIYVALFPCNNCAKIIIQSRIKEVVFFSDKHKEKIETRASKRMLHMAGISVRQFLPNSSKIKIILSSPYRNELIQNGETQTLQDFTTEFSDEDLKKISNLNKNVNRKRTDYITWEEYFMALVFLSAQRSKDPSIQLGACIVNDDNKIVGIGYNGMPRGCSDDSLPWISDDRCDSLENKNMYVCHAEMNAILNKNRSKIGGCKMYVSTFPCNDCAKLIIQEEIKEVIYFCNECEDSSEIKASKIMFNMVGVKYRAYEGRTTHFTVDFTTIDWNNFNTF